MPGRSDIPWAEKWPAIRYRASVAIRTLERCVGHEGDQRVTDRPLYRSRDLAALWLPSDPWRPSVRNRPWRPICPMDPEGWRGVTYGVIFHVPPPLGTLGHQSTFACRSYPRGPKGGALCIPWASRG
jgi:hypothetical protein